MLQTLLQQQQNSSYNPTPQGFYGPGAGLSSHQNTSTQGFNRPDHQAFPGRHVNNAPIDQSSGHGVRSPSAASAGGNMMQQQQSSNNGSGGAGGQPYQFTSAPYTNTVPAQAPSLAHQFAGHQQHTDPRHSASLQQRLSPHAGAHHQPHQPDQPTPPNKYPMAAPPLPHTPTSVPQSATSNNALASPRSPQSPGSQNREQQRINVLFEINVVLLQEITRMQAEGQGGAMSQQQQAQLRSEGKPDKLATEEYVACLRRVQANLSYLAPKASADATGGVSKPGPPGPAHMTPPAHMPQLGPKYEQLRELFPGWSGMDHRPSQSSSSPGPNASNGTAQAQA